MEGVSAGQGRKRNNTWSPSTHPDEGHRELAIGTAANNYARTLRMLPAPPVLTASPPDQGAAPPVLTALPPDQGATPPVLTALPADHGEVHQESDEWTEVLDPSTKRLVHWVEDFELHMLSFQTCLILFSDLLSLALRSFVVRALSLSSMRRRPVPTMSFQPRRYWYNSTAKTSSWTEPESVRIESVRPVPCACFVCRR